MKFTEGDCCKGFLSTLHAGRMQSGGVQVGAPHSHTAQTLAVRAAGMSCFQAQKIFAKSHGPQPRWKARWEAAQRSAGFLRIRVSLESGFG